MSLLINSKPYLPLHPHPPHPQRSQHHGILSLPQASPITLSGLFTQTLSHYILLHTLLFSIIYHIIIHFHGLYHTTAPLPPVASEVRIQPWSYAALPFLPLALLGRLASFVATTIASASASILRAPATISPRPKVDVWECLPGDLLVAGPTSALTF